MRAEPDAQVASISKRFFMANIIFGYLLGQKRFRCWSGRLWQGVFLVSLLSPGPAALAFPGFGNLAKEHADHVQGDALYQQAYAAYHDGNYSLAERLTEQADKLKPDQADGWNLRGVVLLKLRSYDQAEAAFKHSLACDPDFWAAQFNVAEVPYQRKDYARARSRFEQLLSQTDRYKDNRKWEMVLYKTFLSYLFSGDEAGAKKKLAKLSAAPGTNPVLVYADAAVAFQRKDTAGAQRMIAAAQGKFPQETNDLFAEPLVQAGWITVLPSSPAISAGTAGLLSGNGGAPAALGAANGVVATPGGVYNNHQPVVIDPKLEAAAAEPLPEPDGAVRPMLTKVSGVRMPNTPSPAPAASLPRVAPTPKAAATHPLAGPLPDASLEHAGLLLE